MPSGLRRFQQTRQMHFITFSCYRRQPKLSTVRARNIFEHSLEQTRRVATVPMTFPNNNEGAPDLDSETADYGDSSSIGGAPSKLRLGGSRNTSPTIDRVLFGLGSHDFKIGRAHV